jgi:hypothetical protein
MTPNPRLKTDAENARLSGSVAAASQPPRYADRREISRAVRFGAWRSNLSGIRLRLTPI